MSGSAPLQQHRTNCTRAHTATPHITQHGANSVCSGKLCSGRAAPCRMGREANATRWGGGWRVLRFRAFSNFWGVISSRFGFVKTESTSNIAFSRTLIVWIQHFGNKRDLSSGDLGAFSFFAFAPLPAIIITTIIKIQSKVAACPLGCPRGMCGVRQKRLPLALDAD